MNNWKTRKLRQLHSQMIRFHCIHMYIQLGKTLMTQLKVWGNFYSLVNQSISTDDTKVILNEGMPHHRNPFDKGRLFVQFKVSFCITCTLGQVLIMSTMDPHQSKQPCTIRYRIVFGSVILFGLSKWVWCITVCLTYLWQYQGFI